MNIVYYIILFIFIIISFVTFFGKKYYNKESFKSDTAGPITDIFLEFTEKKYEDINTGEIYAEVNDKYYLVKNTTLIPNDYTINDFEIVDKSDDIDANLDYRYDVTFYYKKDSSADDAHIHLNFDVPPNVTNSELMKLIVKIQELSFKNT